MIINFVDSTAHDSDGEIIEIPDGHNMVMDKNGKVFLLKTERSSEVEFVNRHPSQDNKTKEPLNETL